MISESKGFTVEDDRPLQSTEGALTSPLSAGAYALLSVLDQGGMATVFLARKRGDPSVRFFAVKRLHAHLSTDAQALVGLRHEARLGKLIGPPAVPEVVELLDQGPRPLLVSEHLRGITLAHLLEPSANARLPEALGLWILSEVLAVLSRAHDLKDENGQELEVVHCDVSPQNIFVGWDGRISLLDFGIAKIKGASRATTGIIRGKIAYVSPEQALGRPPDRRSDLWSVGAIAWEVIAGKSRLDSEDFSALSASITAEVIDLRQVHPDVPAELAELVSAALDRAPAARPQTAEDFRTRLAPFLQPDGRKKLGEFLAQSYSERKTAEDQLLERLAKAPLPRRTKRVMHLALGLVSLLLVVGATAFSWGLSTERSTGLSTERSTGSAATVPSTATVPSSDSPEAEPGSKDTGTETERLPSPDSGELLPKGPSPTEPSRQDPAPPASSPAVASDPRPPAPAPPRTQVKYGGVTLICSPWAQVFSGGRMLGTTPLVDYRLPVGTHDLVLQSPTTGKQRALKVTVVEGQITAHRVQLE